MGTSVLRPIFTVRSPPRCISRYKVDLLMPSDRAASLGDIAIGSFILEVYLSCFGLLTFNLVRHPSQGSYVLTIFSHDVCSLLRVSRDFFLASFGAFSGKIGIFSKKVFRTSVLGWHNPQITRLPDGTWIP